MKVILILGLMGIDGRWDDERVLKWLANEDRADGPRGRIGFTISADMTEPLRRVCEVVVTNREGAASDLIRWHWEKAGTIELSLLTYNVLSALPLRRARDPDRARRHGKIDAVVLGVLGGC